MGGIFEVFPYPNLPTDFAPEPMQNQTLRMIKPFLQARYGALYRGGSEEVLKNFPPSFFTSIVTDPPYGLKFMNKAWDYSVPSVGFWREALRVLRPGAHALIFAGSRTQHRMAVNVEDAGFQLKDTLVWLYGSGFPKATDVSKQIDKQDAAEERMRRSYRFTKWFVENCALSKATIDQICGTSDMARHWTDIPPNGKQPAIPTQEYFNLLKPFILCDIPEWVEGLVNERTVESENFKKREVVAQTKNGAGIGKGACPIISGADRLLDITKPATPEAEVWDGWKTHLKPAYEPIILAMKANAGSYAKNALEHGVAGMNIDGCRIVTEDNLRGGQYSGSSRQDANCYGKHTNLNPDDYRQPLGRFPANIILDEVAAEMLDAQSGFSRSRANIRENNPHKSGSMVGAMGGKSTSGHQDSGGASRFFYVAKASRSERNIGCGKIPEAAMTNADKIGGLQSNFKTGSGNERNPLLRNNHPTVKPLKLMEHLCRLVSYPRGTIILDPFAGSGTTAIACERLGLNWVAIERDPHNCEIAAARISAAREFKT